MKKILFADMDGTLLNKESRIANPMGQALEDMCKEGHVFVVASGRPLDSILEVMKDGGVEFPGVYIIANNGTLIYDCDTHKTIREFHVAYEDVAAIWKMAEEYGIHVHTYTDTHIVSSEEDKEVQYYRSRVHLPLILSQNPLDALKKEPNKLLCIDLERHDLLQKFQKVLQKEFGDRLQTVFSNPYFLEIFAKEAGKGNGLHYLCNYLDIPVENSIAAGDAQNDFSMLKEAGLSVAMCNGDDEIKKMADVITRRTNDECGLADVIYERILG